MRDDPILLTGVYRSGTTILSCMLGAHPEINFTYGSVNYLRWFVKRAIDPKKYKEIALETEERLFKRYQKKISSKSIINSIESSKHEVSHALIYSAIMEDFFNNKEKRWGEKTLLEWTNIPTFISMYPNSKALHIIRDPRDVIASFKNVTFEPGNRYLDAIFASMHSMDTCMKFKKELPKDRYYHVAYESLITNPEFELEKICNFLEIEYSDSMMDKSLYKDQFGDVLEADSHTSYSDNKKNLSGRWRDQLNDKEVAIIEGLLLKQLEQFNYTKKTSKGLEINNFLSIMTEESLLKSRFLNYLETGHGCEEYPSDPTKEENWTVLGEKNKGAASLYLKNKK